MRSVRLPSAIARHARRLVPLLALLLALGALPGAAPVAVLAADPTFTPGAVINPAGDTYSVAVGDFNGDGALDLVLGNAGPNQVYLGDGRGGFNLGSQFSSLRGRNSFTPGVAVGDFNGDANLDLVLGNYGAPSQVYLGDGRGGFNFSDELKDPVGNYTSSVAVGDLNGDGALDIVLGSLGHAPNGPSISKPSYVYFGDGRGGFSNTPSSINPNGSKTSSVAMGDLDGDGKLDLVLGNYGQSSQVYLSGGHATLPILLSGGNQNTTSVAVADLNGDGGLDLVLGNYSQSSQVYLSTRTTPSYAATPVALSSGIENTYSVAVGDLSGDGVLDIALGNFRGLSQVYVGDGRGGFSAPQLVNAASSNTHSVAAGDFNGDSSLDLLLGDWSGPSQVYLGDGYSLSPNTLPVNRASNHTQSVAVGDFNGDTKLDVVLGNTSSISTSGQLVPESSQVYLGDGHGNFSSAVAPLNRAGNHTQSVAVGDFNGDGKLDIVLGNTSHIDPNGQLIPESSQVYLGDGRGGFSPTNQLLNQGGHFTRGVAVGDFNGDGKLDIVFGNTNHIVNGEPVADSSQVYLGDGSGGFSPTAVPLNPAGNNTQCLAVGDFNDDGALDIVLGNANQLSQLYLGDGRGGFRPAAQSLNPASALAAGDFNGDGALDLVLGNPGQPSQVYLGDGRGGFSPTAQSLISAGSAAVSDFNADGALDLVLGGWVYLGDGQGGFNRTAWSPSAVPRSLAAGDLNGDGLIDLVFGHNGQPSRVYLNPGSLPGLINTPPVIAVSRPGPTPDADFYSAPAVLGSSTIPIRYRLIDREANQVREVRAFYSLDGGGSWRPALAATGTITRDLAASSVGVPHVFNWDTFKSGFFGQSDNVVIRMLAIPGVRSTRNGVAGPFQRPFAAATTFPFRARGTVARVMQSGVPVTAPKPPALIANPKTTLYFPMLRTDPYRLVTVADLGALVYRIHAGQPGLPLLGRHGGLARTDLYAYLGGRDSFQLLDQLVALKPIAATTAYTVYLTNATPTLTGTESFIVRESGVQTLTVSTDHPLVLLNLTVSLEWDARGDQQYLALLTADLKRASELLYNWTKGQVALGDITVYHAKQNWNTANIQIYASNQVRPNAAIGGISNGGQIRIGATWNRYGEANGILGEDWPRALAHELGHYAFGLDDNYLGLDAQGRLILTDSCPGVMSNPYRADQSDFRPRADWLPDCEDTLANHEGGRWDWQTIVDHFPWLRQPAGKFSQLLSGPNYLPLTVTQVRFVAPANPGGSGGALVYLTQGGKSVEPGGRARAFLFQSPFPFGVQRLIDLGSPTLDQVLARGARPGDRLCVYDLGAQGGAAPRLGCAAIRQGGTTLELRARADWQPDVTITPLKSTSVSVAVGNLALPPGRALKARLYPANGLPSAEQVLALSSGQYIGAFTLAQPALAGYVHLWVDEPEPRREIVVAYGLGGSPTKRGTSGGAPVLSPDGQALLYGNNLSFAAGQLYTLQAATHIPSPPAGAWLVGQAYRLNASPGAPDLASASLNFSYLGRDVPAGQNNPDWLKIYYLPPGGAWQTLTTDVDVTTNNAVAGTRGPGLYALMIGIEIPLVQGMNYIVYPVQGSQPVRQALRSIEGAYTLVGTTAPGDGGNHRTFDPRLPDSDPHNTLKQLEFGAIYAITVSRNVTLRLDASGGSEAATAAVAPAAAASAGAPAIYDLALPRGAGDDLAPGLPVIAEVNGVICGGGHTVARDRQLRAVVVVAADGPAAPGCGAPGRAVTFQAGARTWSAPWGVGGS